MKTLFHFAAITAVLLVGTHHGNAADFLIVVDSSGSMSEPTEDGQTKMEAAKQALQALKSDLSAHQVGMTLFGHRVDPNLPGSCQDVETVLPISSFMSAEYDRVIRSLSPKGNTPLAEALRRATAELMFRDRETNKVVIVVTDGNETCGGDPIAIAAQMQQLGIRIKLHVIGFAVKPQEQAQLKELAKVGKGEFGLAKTQAELETLMRKQIDSSTNLISVKNTVAPNSTPKLNPIEKALVARLKDSDRNVRTSAAQTLQKMKSKAAASALFDRLTVEEDTYYAWPAALAALGALQPERVDEALVRAIRVKNPSISVSAINAGSKRKNVSTAKQLSDMDQALIEGLEAKHRDVRTAAAKALQARKTVAAVPFLAKRLLVETDGYYAWPAALWALNDLAPETAMTTIVQAMEAENTTVRNLAAEYAAKLVSVDE